MTTMDSFVRRLAKVGIKVTFIGNYPWIYLDTVNDRKVHGTFQGEHGFTVFFKAIRPGQVDTMTDIPTIFKKIRETLKAKAEYESNTEIH